MKPRPTGPSVQELRELLDYDPATGVFRWKPRHGRYFKTARDCKAWNTNYAGRVIDNSSTRGYKVVILHKTRWLAHRLAWTMHTGVYPAGLIDHINGDTSDNRFSNLRECTATQNSCNRPRAVRNKSGYKGVSPSSNGDRWRATIAEGKRWRHLGVFDTPEEAHAAYVAAAAKLHGEFAMTV